MATEDRGRIWAGLARELLHRPDVRPEIKTQLDNALQRGDTEESAREIRMILASSTTRYQHLSAGGAATPIPHRGSMALAKHALALIEHGLGQIGAAPELVPSRLTQFLRETLLGYARAYDEAGQPEELTSPQDVANRVLTRLEDRQVPGRPARVGVLTAGEVAAIAAQQMTASQAPTVRATGRINQDLEAWYASKAVPEKRKEALKEGRFEDGEYLLALIQPTLTGQTIEVHAVTQAGRPTPQPVARFEVPALPEPVPAAEALVTPAVIQKPSLERDKLMDLVPQVPTGDWTSISGIREAAITINQARIDLYAEILHQRTDLHGAARRAAERRLERMEEESKALAGGEPDTGVLKKALTHWARELSRDVVRFGARARLAGAPEAEIGRLDALARMGALKTRLDDMLANVRGGEPEYGAYPRLSEQARILVSPQIETASIFDTIGQVPIASASQKAGREPVATETLATSILFKGAERTEPPATERRDRIHAVASASRRLQQALTDIATLGESGLQLSSTLRPLLRPEGMPIDIRPDTRSPLLRNLLLPAMEQVSGTRKAFARMMPSGAALTPEAVYGAILGEAGQELAERKPEVARNLLQQMGGLSSRLQQAGQPPSLTMIAAAGGELRQQVADLAKVAEPPELPSPDQAATAAVGEAVGATPGPGTLVVDAVGGGPAAAIQDVAGALQQEGASLSAELKQRIEPFVQIPGETRVFAGPVATAALSEMGAQGATVGHDVYLREDIMRAGPSIAAPVLGHELVHAQQRFRSVESEESEAYGVESAIRQLSAGGLSEFVKEMPLQTAVTGESKPTPEAEKKGKDDTLIDDLAGKVAELWARELSEDKRRYGGY